jgi:hypothetical protein
VISISGKYAIADVNTNILFVGSTSNNGSICTILANSSQGHPPIISTTNCICQISPASKFIHVQTISLSSSIDQDGIALIPFRFAGNISLIVRPVIGYKELFW